ncbi:hypothetical protein GNI_186910 [Gregarina niphandrodes]|uniref:Uncharacterized protein n=1 Tax=Gregarina niphandrodes TaxID=110365 RepID=A0A023AWJ1_GRENI|nr:hypothetical protein GNI_186910 [Gregarina niphandrodes]EZG43116.1 hypothetical protein GNI_186910 [Gregarina niphandrodes]|eukprot:XP_011133628.1 hypothetical protein GNI_186910 [Gregarina niphandrodes]
MMCEHDWDKLPDSTRMALIRFQTLRNAWKRHAWDQEDGRRPQLAVYAVERTAGELRKEAKPSEILPQELCRFRVRNTDEARPQGFDIRDQRKHLQILRTQDLPEISHQRLRWYAFEKCRRPFQPSTNSQAQDTLWEDKVLEGNFTKHFRSDDLLLAVRLGDAHPHRFWSPWKEEKTSLKNSSAREPLSSA